MKSSPLSCFQHTRPSLRAATSFFSFICITYLAFYFISFEQPEEVAVAAKASGNSVQLRAQMECECSNSSAGKGKPNYIPYDQPQSFCSAEATLLGPGQSVISYSLFKRNFWTFKNNTWQERKQEWYKNGFHCNIRAMRNLYPGWVMRIYTNLEPPELCDFACEPDVYICDVRNLPTILGNLLNINPTIWRFFVLGDPTVLRFIVRDSDARLLPRERAAVDEWVASKKAFHAMRDHLAHTAALLGGCWGGNNGLIGHEMGKRLLLSMLQLAKEEINLGRGGDQRVLQNVLYDNLRNKFLIHDSYHCNEFNDSVPFPTQRSTGKDPADLVVGVSGSCSLGDKEKKLEQQQQNGKGAKRSHNRRRRFISPCPYECRPSNGKNWTYC